MIYTGVLNFFKLRLSKALYTLYKAFICFFSHITYVLLHHLDKYYSETSESFKECTIQLSLYLKTIFFGHI